MIAARPAEGEGMAVDAQTMRPGGRSDAVLMASHLLNDLDVADRLVEAAGRTHIRMRRSASHTNRLVVRHTGHSAGDPSYPWTGRPYDGVRGRYRA